MKNILLILLLLTLNAFSNNDNNIEDDINYIIVHENRLERLIYLANSYMDTNPEFAFNCAYKANDIAIRTSDIEESTKCYIIMGDIFSNNGSPQNAIPYYESAINNMLVLNDNESLYDMYCKLSYSYHYNNIDNAKSIESMKKAIDHSIRCNDMESFMDANIALGDLYFSLNDYSSAIACYDNVLYNSNDTSYHNYISKALASKAKILIRQKQFEEALSLIDSSLVITEGNSFHEQSILNYAYKAEIYDSLDVVDESKKFYIKAIRLAYDYKEYENCGRYMYNYGLHEIKHNNIEKAINVLKILCDSTETFRWFEICYHSYYQLSKCYAQMNQFEDAYELFNKYDAIYDSAMYAEQEKIIDKINIVHDLSLNVEAMRSKEVKNANVKNAKMNRILRATVICIFSIMLVVIIILYFRHKILYYKTREISYLQQSRIDKMEGELMEMQLKNNKEMMINMAMHLKSYIETIDSIKKELKDAYEFTDKEKGNKIKDIYANLQNNNYLKNSTNNLNKQINEIYKDYLDRLERKYPELTKAEKRLCAMLYVNMSSKEIAVITNTAIRSVETSRYRLRKKFNLLRDDDMVEFLRKI